MVARSDKSISTFIRELLLGDEKLESQSYNNGYNQGFNHFAVACPFCGEAMIFDIINDQDTNQKILEIFGKYMHTECIEKQKKHRDAEAKKWFENRDYNQYY